MRNVLVVAVTLLVCVGAAQGAITLSVRTEPCPLAGMSRYVLSASTGTAEVIATISDVALNGPVHQVWDPPALGGSPTPQIDDFVSRPVEWFQSDTCLLVADDTLGDNGAWVETNDGTAPIIGLPQFVGMYPIAGMGTFGHAGATSEGLDPAHQASTVDILQVVIPTGTIVYPDLRIGYGMPGGQGIEDEFCTWPPIPEPATLSLLAVGGLAVFRRRRA